MSGAYLPYQRARSAWAITQLRNPCGSSGALLASTREGDLAFDPFTGSGTTAVAAKELNRAFVGAELEEEFAELAARRVAATGRESLLREISKQFWGGA